MSHELICTWLGLPPGDWPPDHYRLLGLEPGESDCARIEQRVHQRLEAVRRYQLLHPELVTEAMNRLAQAYVCLTDPDARRAYDAARFGRPAGNGAKSPPVRSRGAPVVTPAPALVAPVLVPAPERPPPPRPEVPPVPEVQARPVALPVPPSAEPPPPVPVPTETPPPGVGSEPPVPLPAAVVEALPAAPPPAPPQPRPKADPVLEASRSGVARRGLGTRRAIYHRLAQTRRLMRAWERAGKYFGNPKRKLTRPAEATELINRLKAVREALEDFPPLLGEAGQPGYSVVVLARQQAPVPIFQTLLPGQRETLAQHWKGGRRLLQAHREFLREEIQSVRKRGRLSRALRAVRMVTINDHAVLVLWDVALTLLLVLLALLAVVVAIGRD
ncbi:MAG TPA: hypothetical protein VKA46_25580 [Gemmataceae bacterium]|nr:hypothetical protein [Gemmataceae bacterium]